jgi:hypothetical protein
MIKLVSGKISANDKNTGKISGETTKEVTRLGNQAAASVRLSKFPHYRVWRNLDILDNDLIAELRCAGNFVGDAAMASLDGSGGASGRSPAATTRT